MVWISGRKDVLAGFFALLSVWLALRAMKGSADSFRRHYLLALVSYVAALLAKPVAAALPLMIIAIDVGLVRGSWRSALRCWAPWLVAAVPLAWLTKMQQPDHVMGFITPWPQRPVVAADAIVFYLSRLLFPLFLTLNYGRTPEWVLAQPWSLWEPLLFLVLCLLLWMRPARSWWCVGLALFCLNLLPVLGFVPFYYQVFSTVADRFLYLSLLGPALLVAWALRDGKRWRVVICSLALVWLGAKCELQTQIWRNNQSLVEHIAQWNPNDPDIQYSLGIMMTEASKPPEGASHYTRMLRLPPPSSDPRVRAQKGDEALFITVRPSVSIRATSSHTTIWGCSSPKGENGVKLLMSFARHSRSNRRCCRRVTISGWCWRNRDRSKRLSDSSPGRWSLRRNLKGRI